MSAPARLALITGGCRRVGAAIAAHLAAHGWALALHGHSDTQPEDMLAAALAEHQTEWQGFQADLSGDGAPETLINQTIEHFGRAPDLLVNNASLFGQDDWHALDRAALEQHFAINLYAPLLLATQLVKCSAAGAQPAIVNLVDQRVRNPVPDQLAYTLSKQALGESIRTMARALGARARVNGVAPGLTLETDDYSAQQMQRLAAMMPLDRLSTPVDIARAVAWLADADAVTGQLVFVDGGAHLESYNRDFMHLAKDAD